MHVIADAQFVDNTLALHRDAFGGRGLAKGRGQLDNTAHDEFNALGPKRAGTNLGAGDVHHDGSLGRQGSNESNAGDALFHGAVSERESKDIHPRLE